MSSGNYLPKDLRRRAEETRALVAARFPKAFLPKGVYPKRPLKHGIRRDLAEAMPELRLAEIRLMMEDYCSGSSYLAAIQLGVRRIDLDGNETGEPVSQGEVDKAKGLLLQKHHRRLIREFIAAVHAAFPVAGQWTGQAQRLLDAASDAEQYL